VRVIVDKFALNGAPLYLKLAFEKAKRWHSYDPEISFKADIDGVLDEFFEGLERSHGLLLPKVCGYLLSGKHQGLTENELLDLLVIDEGYWQYFIDNCHPSHRQEVEELKKLPIVVWSRLFLDLEPYLTTKNADGLSIMSFYHRKFIDHAQTKYLSDPLSYHHILAGYFEKAPLYLDEKEERPNVRKVVEQPYQETLSNRWIDIADKTLASFTFLVAKTKANMVEGILEDYRLTWNHAPHETQMSLRIWEAFFGERAHILRRGNAEWPAYKILLQLAVEHADESPLTLAAERYLEEGKVRWVWLRRMQRAKETGVSPCLAVLEGHTNVVYGAFQLADGRILSRSEDKTLRIWDTDGRPISVLKGHKDWVSGALQLTDERVLSWSGGDTTLRIWDTDGRPLAFLEGHTDWGDALQLTDGRMLSWSEDKTLRIWDTDGSSVIVLEGHTASVTGAFQLADGRILSRSEDKTLRIWDADGRPISVLVGHKDRVSGALQLSGGRILSWGDITLRIWDADGRPISVLKGHKDWVSGALQLTDERVLSWSGDKTLRIWDTDGRPLAVLEGHTHSVEGALQLTDGRILSWSRDTTLRIWDTDGRPLAVLEGHTDVVWGALQLTDGRVLSWSPDMTLRIWDTDVHAPTVLDGHAGVVSGALHLTEGRILSWSVMDKALRIWDTYGHLLSILEGHTDSVRGALHLTEGRILSWSWSSDDTALRIWDTYGHALTVLEGHADRVCGALQLIDGRILSWSWDKTLRIWDTDGRPLAVLEGHPLGVYGAVQLHDGRVLSWSEGDGTLRIWNTDGRPLAVLEGHTRSVEGALQLIDGRILSWSWDKTLRIWDIDGRSLAVLEAHTHSVNGALQLTDGRILSWEREEDKTLLIWNSMTGACVEILNFNQFCIHYPESIVLYLGKGLCYSDLFSRTEGRYGEINLPIKAQKIVFCARWQAESACAARLLRPDGTLVLTQANGQVCFLRLYNGTKRISLDELLSCFGVSRPPSNQQSQIEESPRSAEDKKKDYEQILRQGLEYHRKHYGSNIEGHHGHLCALITLLEKEGRLDEAKKLTAERDEIAQRLPIRLK
jgi:WD40 repeat protein